MVNLALVRENAPRLGFFRFRHLGGKVLLTNDVGDYIALSPADFQAFVEGRMTQDLPMFHSLLEAGFLRNDPATSRAITKYRNRNWFLSSGPNLHIVTVTLRCNHACSYCHASRANMDRVDTDMTEETARQTVDMIFKTTSPAINIEFQGGEPLVNFPIIRFITEYATEKNKEAKKHLAFTLVSNLTLMDEEKINFFIDHGVLLCTSLDGPPEVHNRNRAYHSSGNSYEEVTAKMAMINAEYRRRGLPEDFYHVDALMTTTRHSLPYWKEIVDTYVGLGLKVIHLRSLNPYGWTQKTARLIGYTAEQFIEFYQNALNYIIELNLKGVEIMERAAALHLQKILSDRDPNYMELRSPCGAGIGQVGYNHDGGVFTCDEGRMLKEQGDDNFELGHVARSGYRDIVRHDTVKAMLLASTQDFIPGCKDCAYKPYCGVCPIYNYTAQGDLFGQMSTSAKCRTSLGMLDPLFLHMMGENREQILKVFERWITIKDSFDHYAYEKSACGP